MAPVIAPRARFSQNHGGQPYRHYHRRLLEVRRDWITTTHHPRFNRLYTELVYQPMIELLSFLGANGFQDLHRLRRGVEFIASSPSASTGFRRSR
jgi:hypothetical protein